MSSKSFLFDICDFHITYVGCSNRQQFLIKDYVMLGLCLLIVLTYGGLVIQKLFMNLRNKRSLLKNWNQMDTFCMISMLHGLFRTIFYVNIVYIYHGDSKTTWSNERMEQYVRTSIFMELVLFMLGSLAAATFIDCYVQISTSMLLYQPIDIRGKKIDLAKLIRVLRLVILIVYIILASIWATKGVTSGMEDYMHYRRAFYCSIAFACWFISAPIVFSAGRRLVFNMIKNRTLADSVQSKVTAEQSASVGNEINSAKSHPVRNKDKMQVSYMNFAIYYFTFILYGCLGLYFFGLIVGVEVIKDSGSQFIISIVCDAYFWLCIYGFSFYLLFSRQRSQK
ncbi:hypothetical protein BC833DRAFT_599591 [Globomyces pollinis-pini]|nr:hypothetical protein BC833DRAFT_599591 [Globomyces pollinis-pini]